MEIEPNFWQLKSLREMNDKEWELLCDGCGKCCLNKVIDEDSQELFFTDVACRLFNPKTCLCKDYKNRKAQVADCHKLTPKKVRNLSWLPASCAYRLIDEGKNLPDWHHLISGSKQTIHSRGQSVKNKVIIERDGIDLEDHIVDWIEG